MFIGHFGVGFGAKAVKPTISLGTLFLASQFIDLLWPTFLLLGIEQVKIVPGITTVTPLDFTHYPYSHSLLMVCVWGVLVGGIYWLVRKSRGGAILLAACVVSHWVLDLIVHRPDLPLSPAESTFVGFDLWNSIPGTVIVEGLIFALGVYLYTRVTAARDRVGSIGFWSLVGFLVLIYIGNLTGPPPSNTTAIAWVGQAQWLLVIWAYWIDRHRVARAGG